jgi:hypothetical protein
MREEWGLFTNLCLIEDVILVPVGGMILLKNREETKLP